MISSPSFVSAWDIRVITTLSVTSTCLIGCMDMTLCAVTVRQLSVSREIHNGVNFNCEGSGYSFEGGGRWPGPSGTLLVDSQWLPRLEVDPPRLPLLLLIMTMM